MRHRFLLACLVLSGFAGLAYELLWVRLLALGFGSTALSFSTVLAVFFGGLALGSWLAGRRTARLARPVRAYALIEIITGISGLLLYPILVRLGDFFALVDPGPGLAGALLRLAVATPLLLIPTVLMGATLPVVTAAVITRDEDVGRGTALIYGFNTVGAFLGVYLVTYHLLPALGVFQTELLTAGVNFAVGIIALIGSRQETPRVFSPAATHAPTEADREHRKLTFVAAALTLSGGFAAIALQVVWVRLFSTFLDGTIYGIGSVLIAVLAGIAAGSLLIARVAARSAHPGVWLVGLQVATLLAVLALSAQLPLVSYVLSSIGSTKGGGLQPLHAQLAVVVLAIIVPTSCSGASFPLLVRIVERRAESSAQTLGSLYAANTVGSILGSFVTGFFLLPYAGSEATLLLALVATAAVGSLASVFFVPEVMRPLRLVLAAGPVLCVALYDGFDVQAFAAANIQHPSYAAATHYRQDRKKSLVYFSEGKVATVAVYKRGTSSSLALNGLGQGSRNEVPPHHLLESVLVGLVPLAHADAPKETLVVGIGAGVTVDVLLKASTGNITVLELEPKVVDAVRAIFPTDNPLESPRVRVELNDARHYLMVAAHQAPRYDLITSMPAHPWVAASIFTREFFRIAKSNLTERGVFCTWFGLDRMDAVSVQSLFRAFTAVFDSYVIYWVPEVGAYYLVGGREKLSIDPDRLRALGEHPLLAERRNVADPFFLPLRVYASGAAETAKPPPGVVNTDDSAFVEVHAPRSSTTSGVLRDFMPQETLLPELVAEPGRASFFVELLEQQMGTPGGRRLGVRPSVPRAQLERTFANARSLFPPQTVTYFEGRLALGARKTADGLALLESATADDPIGKRARKFRAMALADPTARRQALEALEPETDVLLALYELDRAAALERAREPADGIAEDPLGALFWFAARGDTAPLTAAEKRGFVEHVGPALAPGVREPLLELCERVAHRAELTAAEGTCAQWMTRAKARRASELFRRGRAAGARGDFKGAAQLLGESSALDPANLKVQELLLRSRVEIGDLEGVAKVMDALRFAGYSEAHLRYLEESASSGKLGQSDLDQPAPDGAEPSSISDPESPSPSVER